MPSMFLMGMIPQAVPVMKGSRCGPTRSVGNMNSSSMVMKSRDCAAWMTQFRVKPMSAYFAVG